MWAIILSVFLIHSDYPPLCCNGDKETGDCHPVACDSIAETTTGVDWNGFHFKSNQVYPSFNRECHVCIYRKVTPTCVFIQPSS